MKATRKKRYGVLFSGGTCAGMNATLEFLCRYAHINDAELIGFNGGWNGLLNVDTKECTIENTRGLSLISGGTFLGSCSKTNVFDINGVDMSESCYLAYQSFKLDGIFVLGGDGTSRQADELSQKYPMKFFWLPSTLDNDVPGCDITIGFYTAVENAANSIYSMANDGATMYRHTITQCMGRESGYVTAHAVLEAKQKGAKIDLVAIPEIPTNIKGLRALFSMAKKPLTLVISEGINVYDPSTDSKNTSKKAPQTLKAGHHKDLADTCLRLKEILEVDSKLPIKTEVVGYVQRTGQLSSADKFLAEQYAKYGIEIAINSESSKAIVYKDMAFKAVELKEFVANNKKSKEQKESHIFSTPAVELIGRELDALKFKDTEMAASHPNDDAIGQQKN